MKKWIALLLAVIICLPLYGCGKSEAVKAAEAQVAALEEFSEENKDAYFAANAAFSALSEEEQGKVKNRKKFFAQLDPYFSQSILGEWYPFALIPDQPDTMYNPRYAVTIKENGDMSMAHAYDSTQYGHWSLEYGVVTFSGLFNMCTENESWMHVNGLYSYRITTDTGAERLTETEEFTTYMRPDDYMTALSDVIKVVDVAEVNLEDYFGIKDTYTKETDEFGAHTGWEYCRHHLTNKLYEEGWYYYQASEDFAVELIRPEWSYNMINFENGNVTPNHNDEFVHIVQFSPFIYNGGDWDLIQTNSWYVDSHPTAEDMRFGRAKGKIYYVNAKCVKEIVQSDSNSRILILDTEQYNCFGWNELHTGEWDEQNELY